MKEFYYSDCVVHSNGESEQNINRKYKTFGSAGKNPVNLKDLQNPYRHTTYYIGKPKGMWKIDEGK